MKLAALISGGKDSIYAIYLAKKQGHKIDLLLTMLPKRQDSYMFHHPNAELTKIQAELMGIPIITKKTEGIKEKELKDLKNLLENVRDKVDGIVTGAIASTYQRTRIEKLCKDLGLKCLSPLWHTDTEKYLNDLIENKFKVIITGVAAEGLDESWLGRTIDKKAIEDLKKLHEKYMIHLAFEGGEAETFVLDCPLFRKAIAVQKAKSSWSGSSGTYMIESCIFEDRP